MSWNLLSFVNQTPNKCLVAFEVGGKSAFSGAGQQTLGNASIIVSSATDERATIDFVDIGSTPMGPSNETWGVLISYGDDLWIYRYEGGGGISLTLNSDLTLTFEGLNFPVLKLDQPVVPTAQRIDFLQPENVSPCTMAIVAVIMDSFALLMMLVGIPAAMARQIGQGIARSVGIPAINSIRVLIGRLSARSSYKETAIVLWKIITQGYDAVGMRGIIGAMRDNMTWYQWLITGVVSLAQIAAWVLTDGAAFIAEAILMIAYMSQVTVDIVYANSVCRDGAATTAA